VARGAADGSGLGVGGERVGGDDGGGGDPRCAGGGVTAGDSDVGVDASVEADADGRTPSPRPFGRWGAADMASGGEEVMVVFIRHSVRLLPL
jgi:hypothetical protein